MPERTAPLESLRAGAALRIGGVSLLPIERITVRAVGGGRGGWVSGARAPCAVVVRDERGTRVLDVCGTGVSLDALRAGIPELDALLATATR